MQKMCDNVVRMDSYSLFFVPDWFVTLKQLEIWHDDDEYCNDDQIIGQYKVYQKRKAQKVKIKEELLPIAWHLNHVMDWYVRRQEEVVEVTDTCFENYLIRNHQPKVYFDPHLAQGYE